MRTKMYFFLLEISVLLLISISTAQVGISAGKSEFQRGTPAQAAILKALPEGMGPKRHVGGSQFQVLKITQAWFRGANSALVKFNLSLKSDLNLSRWLKVKKMDGENLPGKWVIGEGKTTAYFPHLKAGEKYLVIVHKGFSSKEGGKLKATVSGELSARNLMPALGFASKGNILPRDLVDGLPVIAHNAKFADVDFYRIRSNEISTFLRKFRGYSRLSWYRGKKIINLGDLVYSGRFHLDVPSNQQVTRYLQIKEIPALKKSGIYLAVMRRAGQIASSYPVTWFSLSDLGVHLRVYPGRIDAYVMSLASGKPVHDVKIDLLDRNGRVLSSGNSTLQGFVRFPGPWRDGERPQLVSAAKDGQFSLVKMLGPALDLSAYKVGGRPQRNVELYLYGPRDLYRPGETVTVSGLLRDGDGRPLPNVVLQAALHQPDGRIARTITWKGNALNYLQTSFPLDKKAHTGRWELRVKLPDGQTERYRFLVQEFLPERMKLSMRGPKRVGPGEELSVSVVGQYLYGSPAAGNSLKTLLSTRRAPNPFPELKKFYFGNLLEKNLKQNVELDERDLDDKGEASISVPPSFWEKIRSPIRLNLSASLLERGGRPITRTFDGIYLPGKRLVGIRPTFSGDSIEQDSMAKFEIAAVNADGKRVAADNLKVRLIRELRDYYWIYGRNGYWDWKTTKKDKLVREEALDVSPGATNTVSFPVEWGSYRIEVVDLNTNFLSNYRFTAGWRRGDDGDAAPRPDRIGLSMNRPSYQPGDRAQITIKPPAPGRGFLMVESDRPLHLIPIEIPREGKTIELPIKKEWKRHDLYISVLLIQPGLKRKRKLPRRMMGLTHLPLKRDDRRLNIQLVVPDKILPKTTLKARIKVSAHGGIPKRIQVTLAAVDAGVLSITRHRATNPADWFFGRRRYGVDARDMFAHIVEGEAGKLARIAFGGDTDRAPSQPIQGKKVQIVSLFSGVVDVDEDGVANIPLQIPYFNGRLRLTAVGFGADRFGSTSREITVAAPLITQIAKPRFLAYGDKSQIAFDLHNLSGQDQDLALRISTDKGLKINLESAQAFKRRFILGDKEKRTFVVPVRALEGYEKAGVRLEIEGLIGASNHKQEALKRDWEIAIRAPWPRSRLRWNQVLNQGESFRLPGKTIGSLLPVNLNGQLSLSSAPQINVSEHVQELIAYPYGCLEQTTSGVYPHLVANSETLNHFGIKGLTTTKQRQAVQHAIGRLFGMQKDTGGFGLWSDRSPEEYWLTVYVTDFLMQAQLAGYSLPRQSLERALTRVSEYLKGTTFIQSQYSSSSYDEKAFSIRSYAALVLSRTRRATLGSMRSLLKQDLQGVPGLSLVQLGLALNAQGDSRRGRRALRSGIDRLLEARTPSAQYGSRVRDLAMSLQLILGNQVPTVHVRKSISHLASSLTERLKERHHLSTQERNALFLAGTQLMKKEKGPIRISLKDQGVNRFFSGQGFFRRNFEPSGFQEAIQIQNQGIQPTWMTFSLSGYSKLPPEWSSRGIHVERRFYDTQGQKSTGKVRVGDLVVVELIVNTKMKMPHLMVVDYLPGGLEPENQALETSVNLSSLPVGEDSEVTKDLAYEEYRDDRYVAAINIGYKKKARLLYLTRAVTPGIYRLPPTYAEDMYRPELRHTGNDAGWFHVMPRDKR